MIYAYFGEKTMADIRDTQPIPRVGPQPEQPVSQPQEVHRRHFLAKGIGGLVGVYLVDRFNLLVRAEQAVNPFDNNNQPPRLLEPEKYEVTIPWLSPTVKRWDKFMVAAGKEYKVDPNYIAILMTMESGGWSNPVTNPLAHGLMQVTPPTEKDIYKMYLHHPPKKYDILDPKTNIEFGTAYIAHVRDVIAQSSYDKSLFSPVELIAAGYNGGPGAAARLMDGRGLTDTQTVVYSRDALNMYRERNAHDSPTYDRWLERGGQNLIDAAKAHG